MENRSNLRIFYYSIGVFGLNLLTILLGVIYLLFPGDSVFWDLSGWLFLISWIGTIILTLFVFRTVDVHTSHGKWLNRLSYITLATLSLAMICMFGASFLLSSTTSNSFSDKGGILAVLYGSFFGCTGMNCWFAFRMLKQSKIVMNAPDNEQKSKLNVPNNKIPKFSIHWKSLIIHILGLLICTLMMGVMVYFAVLSLVGNQIGVNGSSKLGPLNGLMGLLSATFGWLFSIFAWAVASGGVKILRGLHRPRLAIGFGLLGVISGAILLAPMVSVPFMASDVDTKFGEAFGSDWESHIPASVLPYFKSNQIVASEYFLSQPLGDCIVMEDISFYNGSLANETGLQLFFDAYLPPVTSHELPGANSTLIRIHGGGWVIGDKGSGNMALMNRYFATQGYCVFDIQYGLINRTNFLGFAKSSTPPNVMGNFSINDMVRHIGIFCQYLTLHQAEYSTNLSSVFISGGSAGGHLTCATALAIASGNYTSLFGSGLIIKGLIPFYPANGVAEYIDGGISNQEFYDPRALVSTTSPACLIYQGKQDGLVNPQTAQDLKDRYTERGNPACMVIWLPFAGHGSDIAFYGYYNQFFLYYMERFLYLYR
jgi:acetyl esterase/lipase